eukprot:364589-Chlamydomonas_euryale.AAC.7
MGHLALNLLLDMGCRACPDLLLDMVLHCIWAVHMGLGFALPANRGGGGGGRGHGGNGRGHGGSGGAGSCASPGPKNTVRNKARFVSHRSQG